MVEAEVVKPRHRDSKIIADYQAQVENDEELKQIVRLTGHEKRFKTVWQLRDRFRLPKPYWQAVRLAWETTELLTPHDEMIRDLMYHPRWARRREQWFMEPKERDQLRKWGRGRVSAPETRVFRGHGLLNADGWSWTTDKEQAEWFARRFPIDGVVRVTQMFIDPTSHHLLGFLNGRGEQEIVIDPKYKTPNKKVIVDEHKRMSQSDLIAYQVRVGVADFAHGPIPLAPEHAGRYEKMIELLRKHGLTEEAAFHTDRLRDSLDMGRLMGAATPPKF